MAAPLTKSEIHHALETIRLLVDALRLNPAAQAETFPVLYAQIDSLLGSLYEDIAQDT